MNLLIDFKSLESIKSAGFKGYRKVSQLWLDNSVIPDNKDVYLVINNTNRKPHFLSVGVGGHFKDKNPNVTISELEKKWISNSLVLYVGQAGGDNSSATLNSRIRQYLRFGKGHKVGHWGGRYIWQLDNHKDLQFCWMSTPNLDPRTGELSLLTRFYEQFDSLPFANLKL